jgi:hypothetical protein
MVGAGVEGRFTTNEQKRLPDVDFRPFAPGTVFHSIRAARLGFVHRRIRAARATASVE